MKFLNKILILLLLILPFLSTSCEDETSKIGPGIAPGEVSITIDSLVLDLKALVKEVNNYDAKTGNLLLGNLDTEDYGSLSCSFVSRLLCVPNLGVADSLLYPEFVDSCKLIMIVKRGDLTGDSLAPQKLIAYKLNKQLPSDITNNFNPEGYYDSTDILGIKSYTVSNIAFGDSAFHKYTNVAIEIKMPKELGQDVFTKYRTEPEIFQWPQTFAQYFPGIYVKQTFGRGCVANVNTVYSVIYYHYPKTVTETDDDGEATTNIVNVSDSVMPFIVSPEVLSSNNISYKVADKLLEKAHNSQTVITTPGGLQASFRFPIEYFINEYELNNKHLTTINDLVLSIDAEEVENDFNISVAPNLLLIKTSEITDFFSKNKIPDGRTSFTASFDSKNGKYSFSSMREYIMTLLGETNISDEDVEFTIIPVEITTETVTNNYYGTGTTYVTKCVPYTSKPTMTRLFTEAASFVFSFSTQMID